MNSQNTIQTINLTKTYKFKTPNTNPFSHKTQTINAIDNLNLTIKKGELFGLLGPNGAGKTTLVKILCTLLPPDQGTAKVNGYDVIKQQMKVKQSIGTLFSVGERGFFWRLSGYRNLEFFAAINNVPRKNRQHRINEVLELVGLKDKADTFFQKYSGGMKRKLALARALLADPPILLLDEPTTGLDVTSSRNIRDFIKNNLSKEHQKTVLYTTHYIEEVSQMCDRVAIMNKGKITAIDTPNKLKAMAKKNEVADITVKNITQTQINTLQSLKGVTNLTSETQDPTIGQTHLRIHLQNQDTLPKILNYIFNQNIKLINFRQEEPTLEDAFIELTNTGATQ